MISDKEIVNEFDDPLDEINAEIYSVIQEERDTDKKEKILKVETSKELLPDIEIFISQSLIKEFFKDGNDKPHCPKKIYLTRIKDEMEIPPTESQIKGLFFESLCLGESTSGRKILFMPKKKNGLESVDEERIKEQVLKFNYLKEQYGIIVNKEGPLRNIQYEMRNKIVVPGFENLNIIAKGTADLISPIRYGKYEFDSACIDLKLTKSINTTFGDFCWGNPKEMDHTQAYMYYRLFGLPFFYWVFDYKKEPDNKLFYVCCDVNDKERGGEIRSKFADLDEVIRKTVEKIVYYNTFGWTTSANYDSCKNCPLKVKCDDYNDIPEL